MADKQYMVPVKLTEYNALKNYKSKTFRPFWRVIKDLINNQKDKKEVKK
jgi:hypothetical protein